MASARCPVCEDIITIGIAVKLYQPIICPTCLASLKVVSVNPFELDVPERGENSGYRHSIRHIHKRNSKSQNPRRISEQFEEDDFEDFDDYTLERSLRIKPEHENRRKIPKGG
jgi:Alpha-aminoadipate carrier protein LysW-like, globular domain